jgi:hypothetical protein
VADDEDESVHHEMMAHLCFLAASPFFRAILQSGMKEAQERRIELTNITRQGFSLVLEFLHTGMFKAFPSEFAFELLRINDQYEISPLLRLMIEEFISRHILNADNALAIYHHGVLNNSQKLQDEALVIIRINCVDDKWMKKNRDALETLSPALRETLPVNTIIKHQMS